MIAVPLLFALIGLTGCSSAPAGPKPGTPAFYWQAAKEAFANKDYLKTADHLALIVKTQNEFTKPAQAMRLVLTAGMVKGYMDLASSYEVGAKANPFKPMPYRKVSSDYLKMAEIRALEFGQTHMDFMKSNPDANINLEFGFPSADMTEIQELKPILAGRSLPDEALQPPIEKKALAKSIALSASAAVGAAGDTAKGQAAFQTGSAQVPRETFMLAMASSLHDQAELFGRKKLDKADRLEMFVKEAKDALKQTKDSKESKILSAKLDKLVQDNKSR